MKFFEEPKLEVVLMTAEDIICISGDADFGGSGGPAYED